MEAETMGGALRILQVGELRLNNPLKGDLSSFSAEIQAQILNAKFKAAEKLFAAAITEQVDLVLLTGSPTDPQGGSRPYWFLQQEFEQLAKHGIKVVCVESTDTFYWPAEIHLPENVNVITRDQSIGFRLAANQPPVEFEWETSETSEAYDSRIGFNLRLMEVGGQVTSVSYSAHENQTPRTVEVHLPQPESPQECDSFEGTLVEVSPETGVTDSPIQSQVVCWESAKLIVSECQSFTSIQEQLDVELEKLERTRGQKSVPTLLTIFLKLKSIDDLKLTHDLLRSLQGKLLQKAIERNSSLWPKQIVIEHASLSYSGRESSALRVACDELSSMQIDEVYENLDVHALEFESSSFENSRRIVAQRLPYLMNEACI
ncbi:MAG: hypothetical protein HON04_14565 [Planctomicrobium sp.]|nr:hypothetical protein [Planctomicrobium sp.]